MSELHTFIFEGLPVRGALVRLTESWQELLARKKNVPADLTKKSLSAQQSIDANQQGATVYPDLIQNLLGQMCAATVLMHQSIQYQGSLILQLMGGKNKDASPVKLIVVEVKADHSFRATAKVISAIQGDESLHQLVNQDGQACCAITLEPALKVVGQQAYQGIIPLVDSKGVPLENFSQILDHYMLQSQQLDTKFVLAANEQQAVGLLIQRMPREGINNLEGQATIAENVDDALGQNEDFNRLAALTSSIQDEELLHLSVDDILHRLYWNEPIARYAPAAAAPRFACSCSRERVIQTIRNLGFSPEERLEHQRDGISVNCDFCGALYQWDASEAEELFLS